MLPTYRSLGCPPNVACYLQNIYQSAQTERQKKNKLAKSAPKVNKVNGEQQTERERGERDRE